MRGMLPTFFTLLLLAATPPTPAIKPDTGAWKPQMAAFCFPSGIRFVFQEDHTTPFVSIATVHQGGAGADAPGGEGRAHLAEHLWFRADHDGVDVTEDLDRVGASWNAFTEPDVTRFEAVAPRAALPTLLRLEALRMTAGLSSVTDAEVAAERATVVAEGHLGARPIGSLLDVSIASALFAPGHPYGQPAATTTASLATLTREDLAGWAARQWRPSETTLVLMGDTTIENAWNSVNRLFPAEVLGLAPGEPYREGSCPVRLPKERPEPVRPISSALTHVSAPVNQQTLVVAWALPGGMRAGEAEMRIVADVLAALGQAYVDRLVADVRADEAVACAVTSRPLASTLRCAVEVDAKRTPERVRRALSTAAADLRGAAAARVTYGPAFEAAWRAQQARWFSSTEDPASIGGDAARSWPSTCTSRDLPPTPVITWPGETR